MATFVAPSVCRFSVIGEYAGREIANIVDMEIFDLESSTSREEAIEDQAAIIVSAWADHVLDVVSNNYEARTVRWLDLNSADGTVGETSVGTGTDFPATGAITTPPMPGNVAYRINKLITASRGQRKGRMYLVGVAEDATTDGAPNTVTSTNVTSIDTAMAAFKGAVEQDGGVAPPSYTSRMVVVHTTLITNPTPPPAKIPQFEGISRISSLNCDTTLASQRRRLRG